MPTHDDYATSEPKKSDDYDVEDAAASREQTQIPTQAVALAETSSGEPVAPIAEDDQSDAASIGHQTNVLSTRKLLIAFPALSVALFVSMIDQTSVSTSIPMISSDLKTGSATSWVGGSFLIASTAFQLINGRLSDIFGRKKCLLVCLALLAIGDLLCGFSKSKEMLFASRAIAGIGSGGVNSVVMIIVSDITTLEKRGKFQGILGAVIALANGTGPFVGGALVEKVTWRWVFWLVPMLAVPASLVILFVLPLRHDSGHYGEKLRKIDYAGILLNLAAIVLILVPLSGGGVTYAWNSPLVITMITVGAVLAVLFMLYEWRMAKIPILPLRLFKNPHAAILFIQSFFSGLIFFGNFFYLPIYFQSVRGVSALTSGALLLPLIIFTSTASITSGQILARTGRYMPVASTGFAVWAIGTGLKCSFTRTTKFWVIIVTLLVEGWGIGFILQPTLVAILANSKSEDRAVSTGLRNFLRTIGGAFGLVISGAILSNTLANRLSGQLFMTPKLLSSLTSSAYGIHSLGFTKAEIKLVLDAYMAGLRCIYILYAASAGCNLLLSLGMGNTSLRRGKGASPNKESTERDQQTPERQ